ncbi:MAG: hypothetical protein KGM43_14085 [Planctomycetota bacterium]|nr:hypothetical protein [Planctomycetota bacterium]
MSVATRRDGETWKEWRAELVADMLRVAARDHWGLALMAVGWIHLAFFLVMQALFARGERGSILFLSLWAGELAANLFALRSIAGRGWIRSTPLAGLLARIWATFLILSFNVVSLNQLSGWQTDWFKPIWATLSTFGFAATAYITSVWMFVPAVQMYFTGLLMTAFPGWNYAIYGVSWCLALQGVGLTLERRRRRGLDETA